jgi:hypothetical protein
MGFIYIWDEVQIWRIEILLVSRILSFDLILLCILGFINLPLFVQQVPEKNDSVSYIHRKVTAWEKSERIDIHTGEPLALYLIENLRCGPQFALLYLDKDTLLVDLKKKSITFAMRIGQVPKVVLGWNWRRTQATDLALLKALPNSCLEITYLEADTWFHLPEDENLVESRGPNNGF